MANRAMSTNLSDDAAYLIKEWHSGISKHCNRSLCVSWRIIVFQECAGSCKASKRTGRSWKPWWNVASLIGSRVDVIPGALLRYDGGSWRTCFDCPVICSHVYIDMFIKLLIQIHDFMKYEYDRVLTCWYTLSRWAFLFSNSISVFILIKHLGEI